MAINIKVLEGITHAVHVVDLSGQMEDIVSSFYQVVHGKFVSYIRNVHCYLVGDVLDIKKITALSRQHIIDDSHLRSQPYKLYGEITSNKAEAAGDGLLSSKFLHCLHVFSPFPKVLPAS